MKNGFTTVELLFCVIFILGAGGWIANIYKIFTVGVPLAEFGIMEVMRIVGVFLVPLGAVLGYF